MALATEWLVVVVALVAETLAEAVATDLNGATSQTVSLQRFQGDRPPLCVRSQVADQVVYGLLELCPHVFKVDAEPPRLIEAPNGRTTGRA